jgi:hypothetical protein
MVLHPLTVAHPEWFAAVDLEPAQAVATRRMFLAQAADKNMLLHAAHFPWPGLGHVIRTDTAFHWQPRDA